MNSKQLGSMLIYAARYTYNRHAGAANQVVDIICDSWEELSDNDKEQLVRESKNKAVCNRDDWSRVWDLAR